MVQFWVCTISSSPPPPPSPPLPSFPPLRVPTVHLGRLDYDQSDTLGVRMPLTVVAENDNRAATASFSNVGFTLSFHWINVTLLRAAPFAVPCNGSWPLQYDVQAAPVPLAVDTMQAMDADAIQAMDAMGEGEATEGRGGFISGGGGDGEGAAEEEVKRLALECDESGS
ncbi:hypothetical protein ACMD2_19317 [Ananas comosus]|uniref:Late embryogenesis abundant protein LEA-2 subgroup domain-containing protein n=1 Tax=Ananas comosus TaxID=4615 RepID=A0A199UPD2_ANACO|nr:hypothetical protein ACMD2_19317 [Ananas comosus]